MINRKKSTFAFDKNDLQAIKQKMLYWAAPSNIFCYLDNNQYHNLYNRFELLLGVGAQQSFSNSHNWPNDWVLGHISYDYKNDIYPKHLNTQHHDPGHFENQYWFQPQIVLYIPYNTYCVHIETLTDSPEAIWEALLHTTIPVIPETQNTPHWEMLTSAETYNQKVHWLIEHIAAGDCYEINFCVENKAHYKLENPAAIFSKLNQQNPSPFAALYRIEAQWLLSASPERFLYKADQEIISQPIKGTIRKGTNEQEDEQLKEALYNDKKERAENVMIVDLVRNDLAQCSTVGSIKVEELFEVYTFPYVHHLISTVKGTLKAHTSFNDIIKVTFPMGSMTGAPKLIVMQLIDEYEDSKRGLYAGTVGYVMPNGDFDFNVVIRSLQYHDDLALLRYHTGGAITYQSKAALEGEEVALKAKAMQQIFIQNNA